MDQLLLIARKRGHVIEEDQCVNTAVAFWHLADNLAAPAFVLLKSGHAERCSEGKKMKA